MNKKSVLGLVTAAVVIVLFLSYAGIQPFATYKDNVVSFVNQKATNIPNPLSKQVATVHDIFVGFTLSLCVEVQPTNQAQANIPYKVQLFEKGNLRATSTVIFNQPQINVGDMVLVYFPLSRDEVNAYNGRDLSNVFSAKVS
ncbi:hypothetical protein JP09_004615 [Dehalogenimonas etheniformans]|uniref:Uncharacterized protein n=2 Tax=Dehalogenimonas etheniformans TaxID=1536648 RepID=A0A2P5P7W5_9CHLR|nr:hypothetical protein JP09_004615 [Dehalogenimonas etheniformans]